MNVENMKILSIDDNKTNLLIIESYAKILNLEIESFLNPKEALEASFENEYDLVIVDYMMPEINGLEFIQEFLKIQSEEIISRLERILKNIDDDFSPLTIEEFNSRIDQSLEDSKNDKVIESNKLMAEIKQWQ